MGIFQPFFLGSIGQEIVFYDILERKNAFFGYKPRSWKSRKIGIFPRGLSHGFGPKVPIFPTFSFRQYTPRTCIYDILEGENVFVRYKNKKFKKPKSDIFWKGLTHGFGPKIAIFFNFFFCVIEARKMSFTIL